jgi:hypothetical protein
LEESIKKSGPYDRETINTLIISNIVFGSAIDEQQHIDLECGDTRPSSTADPPSQIAEDTHAYTTPIAVPTVAVSVGDAESAGLLRKADHRR